MLKTLKTQFTAFALHIFVFFDLTGKIGYQTIIDTIRENIKQVQDFQTQPIAQLCWW